MMFVVHLRYLKMRQVSGREDENIGFGYLQLPKEPFIV